TRQHEKAKAELETRIENLKTELGLLGEAQKTRNLVTELTQRLALLKKEVAVLEETQGLQDFGFYKSRYNLDTSEAYRNRLDQVRERQKSLIKSEQAAICHIAWTVDGSAAEGKRMTKNNLKLILRAFNGECDAAIAKVKYNNVKVQEARIEKSYDAINKIAENNRCEITAKYLKLRLEELFLTHEYHERKQEELEEQRRIKEEMAEEQRALKELEKAQKDAEKQERMYADALEKARQQLEQATGKKQAEFEAKIADLEMKLADAEAQRQRAISQAQLTKIGHVYVISNLGSFGEDIYKIGMTRRLDPMDRVKELGDASVPFAFDVHAMIYSQNAPALENALHKAFNERRLNKVNFRKEFFHVTLAEIEKVVVENHGQIQFTKLAEAEEFRKSLAYSIEEGLDIGARRFVAELEEPVLAE
ncbi:MAG: DUF4041 domain-containing protein, partial [Candidatus Sericytochromatia bacterium]